MRNSKSMRITGGELNRRRFIIPPMVDEGTVRPTPDRVREAVFFMLKERLVDADVLDLFAGSGAHGYESVSRGARSVVFVERDPRVVEVIKKNLSTLGILEKGQLLNMDATKYVSGTFHKRFQVIFVDPPYSLTLEPDFFRALASHLALDGVIIYRCFKKEAPRISGSSLEVELDRAYGGTRVFFLRRIDSIDATTK